MGDALNCSYKLSLADEQLEYLRANGCELDGYSESFRYVLSLLVEHFLGAKLEDVLADRDMSNFGLVDEEVWVDNEGRLSVSGSSKWKSYEGILNKLAPKLNFSFTMRERPMVLQCDSLEEALGDDWLDIWEAGELGDWEDCDC